MKIYNIISIPRGLQEVECNCQEEYFSGYTAGYEDGKNKGFQSGYTSGWTDGYSSGWTDGYAAGSGGTQSAATELSIVVPSAIIGTGRATVEYQPSTAILDLAFTSSDPDIATISNNGKINVISAGTVNICAEDRNSGLYDCETVMVKPQGGLGEPLGFEIISAGTIGWVCTSGNEASNYVQIEYSLDGETWQNFTSLNVNAGDYVMFRGTGQTSYGNELSWEMCVYSRFTASTGTYFNVEGNLYSLLGPNYVEITSLSGYGDYTFFGLFKDNEGVVSAENLRLPATELQVFCYRDMFTRCTNLTTAPELPAPTLQMGCYWFMFADCGKLNYIKCLATDISAVVATATWTYGVASSGTFVKSPNISESTWGRGGAGIPNNWTVEDAQ